MNAYDYIETYLNGELDGVELQEFEAALQQDAELQQALARHREMIARLQGMRLREKVKKNMVRPEAAGGWSVTRSQGFLAAAAAVALLATAIYFWINQTPEPGQPIADKPGKTLPLDSPAVQENPNIAEQPTTPQDSPTRPRPRPRPDTEQLTTEPGIRLAYTETVGGLEKIDIRVMGEARKDSLLEARLNQAIDFLKKEKPSKAIPLLESVLTQNNALYNQDAEWLLALGWLLRDPAEGKKRLETIRQNRAHAYWQDAYRILRRI